MDMQHERLERRRHPRFRTSPHNSYILLQEEKKTGELIDISMGGAAFHYLSEHPQPCGGRCFSTLLGFDDLCLADVEMVTIADRAISKGQGKGYPFLLRRSVEFAGLSPEQRSLLKQFIWLNTREEKSPVFLRGRFMP